MTRVWRLCQARHQTEAFSGAGARRYGGRWNRKGQAAIYTAATQSLAALEVLVHIDTDLVPSDFVVFGVDIPESLPIHSLTLDELPTAWRDEYPPLTCQRLGAEWLENGRSAVLAVPFAVIPAEINYLINPLHPDFQHMTVYPPTPFIFDERLWRYRAASD